MISDYTSKRQSIKVLKEQLRLFAFNETVKSSSATLMSIHKKLDMHERLSALLDGELNFHGKDSSYASHNFHAFAAKFPPQLPSVFIRGLTNPGDIVLDPMMGSGTTVVEAILEKRRGIGLDIDPLALQISRVKTRKLELNQLRDAGYKVISRAQNLFSKEELIEINLNDRFDEKSKSFINYWFLSRTQRELLSLVLAIEEIKDISIRNFMLLVFSSIIITKSGGVSLAYDLAHSRPHLMKSKVPKNAIEQFSIRFKKNLSSMSRLKKNEMIATPMFGNAKNMPFRDGIIDLIVTSPPYANAIDYMRAHKFSLVWFGESISDLAELRSKYIGSERIGNIKYDVLPFRVTDIMKRLAESDKKKAKILNKYFIEIKSVIAEMFRVLRNNKSAIIVVGTSQMRGINVQTHHCLADIAENIGFEVVGIAKRVLDRNKRMMPARFGKKNDSIIEQRMHEEYVIGLYKPSK